MRSRGTLVGVTVVLASVCFGPRVMAAPEVPQAHSDGQGAACTWSIVPAPNVDVSDNALTAVAAISPTDAWAVGYSTDGTGFTHALALHWDGVSWHTVDTPARYRFTRFYAVAALAPDDVWAAGDFFADIDGGALIEHWNGHAWKVVNAKSDGQVQGLAGIASDDVWAVGESGKVGHDRPFARHWVGTGWKRVKVPFDIPHGWLTSVGAVSPTDVWAGGQPNLTYRWDGARWQEVPGPGGEGITFFDAIAPVGSDDVWAIGHDDRHMFARHWDGSGWTVAEMPHRPNGQLHGAVSLASDDIWAVGSFGYTQPYTASTLAVHWDGSTWSVVSTPDPKGNARTRALLRGVASDAAGLWAVGQYRAHGRWNTLIERCA